VQYVLNGFNGTKITDYASAVKGLSLNQAQLLLSTQKLNAEESKSILIDAGLMASKDRISLSLAKEALAQTTLNDEEQESVLIKLGLIADEAGEAAAQEFCTQKDIEALVAQGLLNEEQKEGILAALGLDSANKSASVSIGLFTKGIWANIKAMLAWMVSNPFGQIMLGAGLLMGAVGIIDLLTTSVEEHREQLSGLKSEYSEIKSELDGVNSELESTQNKIKDLESKGTLTFTEAEELENLRKQNNELKRQNDLLEMQEKIKAKEVNDKFVETMEADAGKIEYVSGNTKRTETRGGYTYEVNVTDITEKEHAFKQIEELSKLYAEKEKATTEEQIKAIDQRIETVNKYLQDKNKEWLEDAEGIDYIQNPTTEDDKKVNEWLDYINDFQDKMAIAMGGDNAKENAFNRLVDNWKFDEALNPLQKLGKEGKVTLDELKKRMDDPVFVEFVNKLKDIGFISDTTDGSLRFLASAFNGTTQATRSYVNQLSDLSSIKKFISNIDEEAKALGTTKEALGDLVQEHILFNNTGLDTSGQISALQLLGSTIDGLSGKTTRLISLLKYAAGDFSESKLSPGVVYDASGKPVRDENGNPIYRTEEEIRNIHARRQGSAQSELDRMKQEWEKIQNLFNDDNNTPPPYTPSDGNKDKGKDNTPDYEDPTDAIINRINLRSKELEQQEESIQNAIEIAELENDYKKQISLTNDLIATRKKRIDELNTANAGLHNEAEYLRNSNPWDEASWFDSQGNATEAYYKDFNSATKEQQEQIKNLFDNLSKYKKSYMENAEEITDINKQILQDEENILELKRESVETFFNEFEKEINDSYDIRISRLNSQSSLLSSHFNIVNAIAEEQHNLNKELLEAETIGAKMNEQERESLLTRAEHNKLSGKLSNIMLDITDLQSDYMHDLEKATEDTIEEVTNQYERQYELKMKEYEIVKAELNLIKKQQILENTQNEKSVRTWNGSSWIYEANLQDVLDAQEEVENAKYELARAQAEEAQQTALNAIDANADALETEKNKLASVIEDMAERMDGSGKDITSMLKTIAETDLPTFDAIIQSMGESIKEVLNLSDDDINAFRTSSNFTINPLAEMKKNSSAWRTATTQEERDSLVSANKVYAGILGLDYEESTGRWKKKNGTYAYASGTKNAKKDTGLFDEEGFGSEVVLTNDGILTQFNGGERVFSPEMADRLWEMAQKNNILTASIKQPDFSNIVPIEEKIFNAISNVSNAFGDTYMIKDVQVNESEGGNIKGFINYLKKKV